MLEVMFCAECIGPINSISWQYHVPRHHGMNFVCKSGFIELKKKKGSIWRAFISVIMMLCPVAVGYLSEELGKAAAQSSVPCLVCASVFFLKFVTWTASWTIGELLLFNEVRFQFFLCKWSLSFFPLTYWGSVYSWV